MFNIEESFDRVLLDGNAGRPTVVFTEALDPRVIEAVCYLARFCRPVLLAPEKEVRYVAERHMAHVDPDRLEFALSECTFVRIKDRPDLIDEFARSCLADPTCDFADENLDQAQERMAEPASFGLVAVARGHGDIVVGGATHKANDFFRPMLRLLARRNVVCETGVFVLPDDHPEHLFPHNIAVFGDVGVNATMTPEVLAEVAVATCAVARDLIPESILPMIRGAVVSYSNRGSDAGPSPNLVRDAMALVPQVLARQIAKGGPRYESIRITGEVKVSVALSRRSAAYYANADVEDAPVEGTNVIIAPNLDMGNLLYHLYSVRFPGTKKFPMLFGVGNRAVDLALDTTPEDIRLAVKATLVRLYHQGLWTQTPKDTFFPRHCILAVNPGSTSTKIAVFENDREVFTKEIQHGDALAGFEGRPVTDQFDFRKDAILAALVENKMTMANIDAVSSRGGLLWPLPHGTFPVNDQMIADLKAGVQGEHASNLGGLIAAQLVAGSNKVAYIVDPVVVDEAADRVRITGVKAIRRKVISHALNQMACAQRYAVDNETFYEKINVIVAHMGGGITIGAHKRGQYIDVNNGLDGEGPFTPQRSGSLPVGDLARMCFSGKYSEAELKTLLKGKGGLVDLLGTSDLREVESRILAGDGEAESVFEAMTYQIAKNITALLPAFDGEEIDRIILTGGMARSARLVAKIENYVKAVGCGVAVYPGENEMAALANGALRVLNGREVAKVYVGKKI